MEKEEVQNKITVSNRFIEIFKNFNVVDQIEEMRNLSRVELYLLLLTCIDKFSEEDPVVLHNLKPFVDEIMRIYDIQDGKNTTDQDLLDLTILTGDKYIETDNIIDYNGDTLPKILNKEEVRDAKINIIKE